MRPVSVTMVGFGTFADSVTVDFSDADVFALVGLTGSGKSTVIDAICFALYGSIPRYDDRRAVGPAVHALAAEARVSLTFELGRKRYVAARVVRRDKHGKASTKDARLEQLDGEVIAGTAREMDTAVPALLGLSFDQFTRAVVLPQGDFARFLHDKPAARQDLLVQLLGLDVYERMMQRARAIAAEANAPLAHDRARIVALAAATPEARAELDARAAACTQAQGEWRAAKPELDAVVSTAAESDGIAAAATARDEQLHGIEEPANLVDLAASAASAEHALVQAEKTAERMADAVVAADVAAGGSDARDGLRLLAEAHALVGTLREEVEPVRAERLALTAETDALVAVARAAEEQAEVVRTASAAHVVREHLQKGEPCPVCEQVVDTLPLGAVPDDWRGARETARAARERADAAAKRLDRIEHRAGDLDERLARASEAVVGARSPKAIAEQLAQIDDLAKQAAELRQQDQHTRRAVRRAREKRDAATGAVQHARDEYRARRDALSAAGLVPPVETDDIAMDWAALRTWAETEAPRHRTEARSATVQAAALRATVRDRLAVLAAEAVNLALEVPAAVTLDDLIGIAAGELGQLGERRDRLEADMAERATLLELVAARESEAAVASELARLLDANHFERWLVSEALARLVDGGSERLRDLSGGRYSFGFDDSGRDLLVVDHTQGDERRSVRTLSGGETFQASLALALALADQLAGLAPDGAARLESIFLDEGFGTLDAETLETVAATIENLGGDDRMVGIVTHVPDLAARMPVQYRVTKGPRSSTVERVTQ